MIKLVLATHVTAKISVPAEVLGGYYEAFSFCLMGVKIG